MKWIVSNATVVTPDKIEKNKSLAIVDSNFYDISLLRNEPRFDNLLNINVHGLLVLPSFINSYDNLLASYSTFLGANHPYRNWLAWDNEIKSSSLFRKRMMLDTIDLYQLGSYRNILCGVTTVLDHIPHHVHKPFEKKILPDLVTKFGLAHSVSNYALKWGEGIRLEHEYSVKNNIPFVIQIANGLDDESKNSLNTLIEQNALTENTVLIHGLTLSLNDLDKIAKAKASLVWCPVSNDYIYQRMAPIKEALARKINICLGSDNAMNGSINIFQNIKKAFELYVKNYSEELDPLLLLKMLTINPKKAFKLNDNLEIFSNNSSADFMIIRPDIINEDPKLSIANLKLEQIYMLVKKGKIIYGVATEEMKNFFRTSKVEFETFYLKGQARIIKKHTEEGFSSLADFIKKLTEGEHNLDFLPISI